MSDRKSALEMLGEFFREAAVLTAVFIPLDRLLMGEPLTVVLWTAILAISGGSLAIWHGIRAKEKIMSEQFLLSIAPIVSLMILAGIAGIYFLWKERREDRDEPPIQPPT